MALLTALVAVVIMGVTACGNAGSQKSETPTSRALETATATIPANALLDDPLSDNHNDWPINGIGSCYFGSDGYHAMAPSEHFQDCSAPMDPLMNGSVTVTVQQISGGLDQPYGIVFRGSTTRGALDDNTFYWFVIDSQGQWSLVRFENSTFTPLSDYISNGAIKTGLKQKNTLSIEFRGQTFTCAVNGVGVGVVTDPAPALSGGGVGLVAQGSNAAFTDFVATM